MKLAKTSDLSSHKQFYCNTATFIPYTLSVAAFVIVTELCSCNRDLTAHKPKIFTVANPCSSWIMILFSKRGFTSGRPLGYQEDQLNSFRDSADSKLALHFYEGWLISGSPLPGNSYSGVPSESPVYYPASLYFTRPSISVLVHSLKISFSARCGFSNPHYLRIFVPVLLAYTNKEKSI